MSSISNILPGSIPMVLPMALDSHTLPLKDNCKSDWDFEMPLEASIAQTRFVKSKADTSEKHHCFITR